MDVEFEMELTFTDNIIVLVEKYGFALPFFPMPGTELKLPEFERLFVVENSHYNLHQRTIRAKLQRQPAMVPFSWDVVEEFYKIDWLPFDVLSMQAPEKDVELKVEMLRRFPTTDD